MHSTKPLTIADSLVVVNMCYPGRFGLIDPDAEVPDGWRPYSRAEFERRVGVYSRRGRASEQRFRDVWKKILDSCERTAEVGFEDERFSRDDALAVVLAKPLSRGVALAAVAASRARRARSAA